MMIVWFYIQKLLSIYKREIIQVEGQQREEYINKEASSLSVAKEKQGNVSQRTRRNKKIVLSLSTKILKY